MTPYQLVNSHNFSEAFLPIPPRRVNIDSVEFVGNNLLRNVLNCLPLYMAPCHRSLEWSSTPLWEPEITQNVTGFSEWRIYFDMDMSYARMVRTASLTSYPVRCKILHQRTQSHKWRHAAAGMRAHNVLCNSYYVSYNRITVEMNLFSAFVVYVLRCCT
jgi:hypothetical protein